MTLSTAGSAARCDAVKELGASFVANHREGSLTEQFTDAGFGGKIDVILDIAGGDLMQANLDLAAPDGRIVCIGVMRGMQSEINLATLFMKRFTLTDSALETRHRGARALLQCDSRTDLAAGDCGRYSTHRRHRLPLGRRAGGPRTYALGYTFW